MPTHPLEKFQYCPVCGSAQFEVNNFKSKHCPQCGFIYYGNPCSATAAFIRRSSGQRFQALQQQNSDQRFQALQQQNSDQRFQALQQDTPDELLIAVRGKEPAKGTLDLPGGFVDMYESAEEGIIREIQEETGLTVENPRYLFSIPNRYLYSGMVIHTLDMFFEVNVDADVHPMANDDAADLRWMPLDSINAADFGLHSISQAVERYLNKIKD
jgi:ADP-ribose pyrophosphatase YjhB (NUDIX family)